MSTSQGVLLAHRRADLAYYPNCWDFPDGHIENGETAAEALARELHEELGVTATINGKPRLRVTEDSETPEGLVLDLWLVTEWTGTVGNLAPDEHDELRWVSRKQLGDLQLAHEAYQEVIAELAAKDSIRK